MATRGEFDAFAAIGDDKLRGPRYATYTRANQMLHAGHEFAPGYRLEEFLGKGQFGQVWRVTAPGGTAAAVKFIDLSVGEGQKEYTAIRRVKAIRHANLMPITAIWLLDPQGKAIVESAGDATAVQATLDLSDPQAAAQETQAIDVIDDADSHYMAVGMLLGGKNLLDHMRECQAEGHAGIPAKQLLRYIEEAAKGLDFLNSAKHDLGEGPVAIQHCDVKPANIVLLGDSAVVCDFGLARILSRGQVTATSAVGTPAYMAPEAIQGRPSSTTDQYALAVTYYQLRTGDLPMASGSMWEILDAHRTGKLDLRGVPAAEQAVLRKATALDWRQRFATSLDMAEALRDAIARPNQSTSELVGTADATIDFGGAIDISSHVDHSAPPTIDLAHDHAASVRGMTGAIEGETASGTAAPDAPRRVPVPVMLAGAGAGAILLIALGLISLIWRAGDTTAQNGPSRNDTSSNGTNGGAVVGSEGESEVTGVVPVQEKTATELFDDAVKLLGTDVDAAAESFLAAAQIDPALHQPQPTVLSIGLSDVEHLRWVGNKGVIVAGGSRGQVHFADVGAGSLLGTGSTEPAHGDLVSAIEVSPDGETVVTGSWDATVLVWSLGAGEPMPRTKLVGFSEEVGAVALHPDFPNQPFVVSGTLGQKLYVHRVESASQGNLGGTVEHEPLGVIDLTFEPWSVAFTADAQRVLIYSHDQGQLVEVPWDELLEDIQAKAVPQPRPVTTEAIETRWFVTAVLGTEDAGQPIVVTGSPDGSISVWAHGDDRYSLLRRLTGHDQAIETLVYHRVDGAGRHLLLSGASDRTARLWNLQTGLELAKFTGYESEVISGSFSAEGRWAATCAKEPLVRLHHLEGSRRSAGFNTGTNLAKFVAIDPRGKWLIAVTENGELYRWELPRAQLITLTQPTDEKGETPPPTDADPPEPPPGRDKVAAL